MYLICMNVCYFHLSLKTARDAITYLDSLGDHTAFCPSLKPRYIFRVFTDGKAENSALC